VDEIAFLNGRVLTIDPDRPQAEALLIRHGRVVVVGTTGEVADACRPASERYDLRGRVVVPGLVDGHCHMELTATHRSYATSCHLGPQRQSIADIVRVVAAAAERTPPGEWVIGRADFALDLYVNERRAITRDDLDAATGDHPCVVFSGLHVCTLNSHALSVTGLADQTATLPPGAAVDVASGRAKEIWDWLPLPTFGRDRVAAAIAEHGRALWAARGVTTIAELPFSHDGIHAFQDLRRRDALPVRIGLWLHAPRLGSVRELAGAGLETGFGDDWLMLGGIKLFVDGIGCDIWGNPEPDHKWTQAELDDLVLTAHTRRLQCWMHVAPTVAAAEQALTAVERAQAAAPWCDHRHRIEHIGDLAPRPALLARIAASGVIPVTTPQFTYSYGDLAPDEACTPIRSLHGLGFRPPGNSDATGTQPEAINPWHSIWCALAHRTRSGVVVRADETITLDDALRMFTRDAAVACHMDDRGMLAAGMLGDLVVLGADPFQVATDDLPSIPIDLTVIGGRPVAGEDLAHA
jgi:predicted amidohydrolase YtcJ